MPFGFTNVPVTFQRTIDIILARLKWQSCLVYIDDIVLSSTFGERLRHVAEILGELRAARLSLKLKKCAFFDSSVHYIGHTLRPGSLQVANRNTDAIQGFIVPTSQTELCSFIGLCDVYRPFVPNFALVAVPFTELLNKEC